MVRVISHRGLWFERDERNTMPAFERSLEHGFGIETDVRDCAGRLVISHDPPVGADGTSLDEFLDLYVRFRGREQGFPLALNIKADGLATKIGDSLSEYGVADAFAFDMSVPDQRDYISQSLKVLTRHSDVETMPSYYSESSGVWLDSFGDDEWITEGVIEEHLDHGKGVFVVSPELHKRHHMGLWSRLARVASANSDASLALCTDYPVQAAEFLRREQ